MEEIKGITSKIEDLFKFGAVPDPHSALFKDNEEGSVEVISFPSDNGKKIVLSREILYSDPEELKRLFHKSREILNHDEAVRVKIVRGDKSDKPELLVTVRERKDGDTEIVVSPTEEVLNPGVVVSVTGFNGRRLPLMVSLKSKNLNDAIAEVKYLENNPYTYETRKTTVSKGGDVVELLLDAWSPHGGDKPILLKSSSRPVSLEYNPNGSSIAEQFTLTAGWKDGEITEANIVPNPLRMLEKTIQLIIKEADRFSKITLLDSRYTVGGSAFTVEEISE